MSNKHDLNKHIGTDYHQRASVSMRDVANTRRYMFANGLMMIAHGALPYDAVGPPEWRVVSGFAELSAPCARTAANMLHDARIAFENDVKAELADGKPLSVSLQIDAWKQKHLERRWIGYFVSATTAQGKQVRALIRLEHFLKSSETGQNVADMIISICREFNLVPDAVVSDTASNMLAATELVQKHFAGQGHYVIIIPCFCHIVSLLCKTFLKAVDGPEKAWWGNCALCTTSSLEGRHSRRTWRQSALPGSQPAQCLRFGGLLSRTRPGT